MRSSWAFCALIRKVEWVAAAVEGKPWVAIAAVSTLYLASSLLVSATKLMWFDELHTYLTSQLPTAHDVIGFFAAGLDTHTPVCSLVERGSVGLLGKNFAGLRAPYILAYLVFSLCLYRFVYTRAGAVWGLAAMTFAFVCSGLYYATEIRPYGLVLALSAMAAVCWQEAGQPKHRRAAIAVLWLSLSLSVALHYYAAFMVVPFILAELSRWRQVRRADWPVAWAIVSSPLIIALFVPAIRKARLIYGTHFWGVPQWSAFKTSYVFLLAESFGPIATAAFLCLLTSFCTRDSSLTAPSGLTVVPPSERTLSGVLALFPVLVVPTSFLTGAFGDRYVVPALTGIILYLILLTWQASNGNRATALVTTMVFLGWFVMHTTATVRRNLLQTGGFPFRTEQPFAVRNWMPFLSVSNLPVVVAPGVLFLQFEHYAPVDLGWRIYYLADRRYATELDRSDTTDTILINLAKAVPGVSVSSYDDFVSHQRKFLFLVDVTARTWIIHKLKIDGAHMELLIRDRNHMLFEVKIQ